MTLETIERKFSELVRAQIRNKDYMDLTINGPLMNPIHPKALLAQLQFQMQPDKELSKFEIPGKFISYFKDFSSAKKDFPQIASSFVARPWQISAFLDQKTEEAIFDFQQFGTAVIALNKHVLADESELHHFVLPHLLEYALSPELWKDSGKWRSFHERLQKLFSQHELLNDTAFPGYYPLKQSASRLETLGIRGSHLSTSYVLILPWTFSLSDLIKLEKIIQQEF